MQIKKGRPQIMNKLFPPVIRSADFYCSCDFKADTAFLTLAPDSKVNADLMVQIYICYNAQIRIQLLGH